MFAARLSSYFARLIATAGLSVPALSFSATLSWADILVIEIDESSLPYHLGPDTYDNSPSRYDNSSSKYDNSESKYDNSPSKYENSAANYDNSISGDRRLLTENDEYIGYYVFGSGGIVNLYSASGSRVAYMPGGGHTQSLFVSEANEWCGTYGEIGGKPALGLSRNCMLRFLLDQ